jgi:hypothetical protein
MSMVVVVGEWSSSTSHHRDSRRREGKNWRGGGKLLIEVRTKAVETPNPTYHQQQQQPQQQQHSWQLIKSIGLNLPGRIYPWLDVVEISTLSAMSCRRLLFTSHHFTKTYSSTWSGNRGPAVKKGANEPI